MIAEFSDEVFDYQGLFSVYNKHFWCGAIIVLALSIYFNREKLIKKVTIANSSDISIVLKVCDVLNNPGAVIIPTNTTFDTSTRDDFISKNSVQGQYQEKYYRNNLALLNKKIEAGLKGKSYVSLKDGRKSKKKRYDIGTVCRISEEGKKRAYFVADSDINNKGIPINVDAANISQTLVKLWDTLAFEGNQEAYSIPLIGTGKAKVKDASRDEIARETIISFLAATREHKITDTLYICISPNDLETIDWDGLCIFLEYQSSFSNIYSNSKSNESTAEDILAEIQSSENSLINGDELDGYWIQCIYNADDIECKGLPIAKDVLLINYSSFPLGLWEYNITGKSIRFFPENQKNNGYVFSGMFEDRILTIVYKSTSLGRTSRGSLRATLDTRLDDEKMVLKGLCLSENRGLVPIRYEYLTKDDKEMTEVTGILPETLK